MENHPKLDAAQRTILGKKSRFLRRDGMTPAHVFGHGMESVPVQCVTAELEKVLRQAGTTCLIKLTVKPERKARDCFIREVQSDAITRRLIHVDFYQVKHDEKIEAHVPVILIGESVTLKGKGRQLNIGVTSLWVECLPADVPPVVQVDLKQLAEEHAIHVKDISLGPKVNVRTDLEQLIAKIGQAKKYEFEEVKPKAKVEAAGAPTAEGEAAPAEGETPAEKKPAPEKKPAAGKKPAAE